MYLHVSKERYRAFNRLSEGHKVTFDSKGVMIVISWLWRTCCSVTPQGQCYTALTLVTSFPGNFSDLSGSSAFLIDSSRLQLFMGNFESAWHRSDLSFAFEYTWVTPLSLPGYRGRVTLPKWGLHSSQHPHLTTPFNCNLLFCVSWEEFFAMVVFLNWQVWKSQNIVLSNGNSRWTLSPPTLHFILSYCSSHLKGISTPLWKVANIQ